MSSQVQAGPPTYINVVLYACAGPHTDLPSLVTPHAGLPADITVVLYASAGPCESPMLPYGICAGLPVESPVASPTVGGPAGPLLSACMESLQARPFLSLFSSIPLQACGSLTCYPMAYLRARLFNLPCTLTTQAGLPAHITVVLCAFAGPFKSRTLPPHDLSGPTCTQLPILSHISMRASPSVSLFSHGVYPGPPIESDMYHSQLRQAHPLILEYCIVRFRAHCEVAVCMVKLSGRAGRLYRKM